MHVEQMQNFFIPINKFGGQSKEVTIEINKTYESDATILYFPAGMVSRRQSHNVLKDLEWKKTFISNPYNTKGILYLCILSERIPIFFNNLSYYRTKLGIKGQHREVIFG